MAASNHKATFTATPRAPPSPSMAASADGPIRSGRSWAIPASTPNRSRGSLAVLLHRTQPCPREIVCDLDGLLCNFWRALRADPEAVAYWAAWPTIHQDLTARHTWLRNWRVEHGGRVETDPDFYDVKVAGWWVWGLSNWIGGGWCADGRRPGNGQIPSVLPTSGAYGVQAQRVGDGTPGVQAQRGPHDKRPHIAYDGGQGVQAQKLGQGNMPHVNPMPGGSGVSATRVGRSGDILDGSRWQPWFAALGQTP